MRFAFRKYHRSLAITVSLPLIVTAVTGIGMGLADEWFHQPELVGFLLQIHTYQIFGLSAILPVVNGLALLGLIATGLSMTDLFSGRRKSKRRGENP